MIAVNITKKNCISCGDEFIPTVPEEDVCEDCTITENADDTPLEDETVVKVCVTCGEEFLAMVPEKTECSYCQLSEEDEQ